MNDMELVDSIHGGQMDDSLEMIVEAIRKRRSILDARAVYAFEPGDRVMVFGRISPKYLIGATGTVEGRRGEARVNVLLDERVGKYSGSVGFPAISLEKIE